MKQQITLREANQHLSRYIEAVEQGDEIIITRRGKPVAKILHISEDRPLNEKQLAAWEFLRGSAKMLDIGKFERDACYER